MWTALTIAASTLVSEDLAIISAGVLVQQGVLIPAAAVLSCAAGILAGDMGLWALGRVAGLGLLRWPWAARRLGGGTMAALGSRLHSRLPLAILASRFTPGARLPLYVSAGILGVPAGRFALWTLVAVTLWTPPLVLGTAALGRTVARVPSALTGGGVGAALVAVAVAWIAMRAARSLPRMTAGRRIWERLGARA
jgi:membrane protein DedA with SNARE-associated domain